MLRKTFLILCASAMLGAAVIASSDALAFGPPPIGGPPIGGPPIGGPGPRGLPPRVGGPAPRASLGGPAGRLDGLSRVGGRAAASGYGRSGGYGYSRSGRYGYGSRYRGYGVDVAGSSSYSCYYTYSRGRRIKVCDETD